MFWLLRYQVLLDLHHLPRKTCKTLLSTSRIWRIKKLSSIESGHIHCIYWSHKKVQRKYYIHICKLVKIYLNSKTSNIQSKTYLSSQHPKFILSPSSKLLVMPHLHWYCIIAHCIVLHHRENKSSSFAKLQFHVRLSPPLRNASSSVHSFLGTYSSPSPGLLSLPSKRKFLCYSFHILWNMLQEVLISLLSQK